MLGNKEEQIDRRHRLAKARLQRRCCELRIVKLFETENNSLTYRSKGCEDLFRFPRIMVRLIGLAVAKMRKHHLDLKCINSVNPEHRGTYWAKSPKGFQESPHTERLGQSYVETRR